MAELFGLIASYGAVGIIVGIAVFGFIWLLAYFTSEPGTEITVLGVIRYQKRFPKPKRVKPIYVTHEATGTLWRITRPIDSWIETDLSDKNQSQLNSILDGPYHDSCKSDLGYFGQDSQSGHTSWSIRVWRVQRSCKLCDCEVVPSHVANDRESFKQFVVKELARRKMAGEKIKSGMTI